MTIGRIFRAGRNRAKWLVRPSGWLWGLRWAALNARWRTGRPITVRHYYEFGEDRPLVGDELVRPEAWDAIRTRTNGPFSLPATRVEWERMADEWPEGGRRAGAIDRWLQAHGVDTLASYGAGGASLELLLHRLAPKRSLIVTDYAPATV